MGRPLDASSCRAALVAKRPPAKKRGISRVDRLAAVLAHEMAHIASKDHFKPRCSTSAEALDREICADAGAVAYLRAADIPPEAMIDAILIIKDVQAQGWANTRTQSVAQLLGDAGIIARYADARP